MTKHLLRHRSVRLLYALCMCATLLLSSVSGVVAVAKPTQDAEPPPQASYADTVRFLEQATFGPTPELIRHVQRIGFEAFLDEQFAAPMDNYPEPQLVNSNQAVVCPPEAGTARSVCQRDNYSMYPLQRHFFKNALYGQDQLRQRVAWALSQIFVVSADSAVNLPSWMRPYQQMLYEAAFSNYRNLLYEVTLNPAMGRYLDMLNNKKFNSRTGIKPNENYAREILQLFSIGVYKLNQDGTLQRETPASSPPQNSFSPDALRKSTQTIQRNRILSYDKLNQNGTLETDQLGPPVLSYDQETIEEFSKVFTGWVLARSPAPGISNYGDRMVANAAEHDTGEKRLLNGAVSPAGQSAERDLNDALDNIFYHENVAPYMSKLLIQFLVTSNPTPAYVTRVAAVFDDNGEGTRGDLKAVVRAILLDAEARGDIKIDDNYGKLREPVLYITNLCRAFNATSDGVLQSISNLGGAYQIGAAELGQSPFRSPTVFNFYPPDNEVPGTEGVLGPEFGIYSSVTAIRRINFAYRLIFSNIPAAPTVFTHTRPEGTSIDLGPMEEVAGDPAQLVEELSKLLLHDAMPEEMRNIVTNAVANIPRSQPRLRAQTAVYLVATSSEYQVER